MGLAGSWISHFARHQFRLGSLFNRNPHQSTLAPSSYIQPRHSRISATHARLKQDLFGRGVSPLQYFNWRNPCCRIEAICGSDLHLYDWFIPTKEARDIPGHEFMGVVEDMCRDVTNLKRGDRLVVHCTIACLQEGDLVKVRQHESECTSNRITLDEVPAMYEVSRDKRDGVTKIVIDPWPTAA